MNTCESHDGAVVVYLRGTCPLCAAKVEIAEHEKENSELKDTISTREETIEELREEIAGLNYQLNN
jgi:transcription initiation factor IIE alpha subunit